MIYKGQVIGPIANIGYFKRKTPGWNRMFLKIMIRIKNANSFFAGFSVFKLK